MQVASLEKPSLRVHILSSEGQEKEKICALLSGSGLLTYFYSGASELLSTLSDTSWGCVLLEIRPFLYNARELQQLLKKQDPALPIIFMGEGKDIETAIETLKSGAFDFLIKPLNEVRLINTVNLALRQREKQLSHISFFKKVETHFTSLSNRESEVLNHLLNGSSNKEISAALNISIKTVEQHRANVMKKMKADSFAELVKTMTQYNLKKSQFSSQFSI